MYLAGAERVPDRTQPKSSTTTIKMWGCAAAAAAAATVAEASTVARDAIPARIGSK